MVRKYLGLNDLNAHQILSNLEMWIINLCKALVLTLFSRLLWSYCLYSYCSAQHFFIRRFQKPDTTCISIIADCDGHRKAPSIGVCSCIRCDIHSSRSFWASRVFVSSALCLVTRVGFPYVGGSCLLAWLREAARFHHTCISSLIYLTLSSYINWSPGNPSTHGFSHWQTLFV